MSNSKKFYAFIGEIRTTEGAAHKVTGRRNTFGKMVAFSTKEKRDHLVSEYYNSGSPSEDAYKTSYTAAKSEYCGGMTMAQYDDHMKYVDLDTDDLYNCYFAQ